MAETIGETATARSLVIDIPDWPGHVAGQHVDIRLTAPDGYQATSSYSLSSGPHEAPQITVERVDDGEVSPYLVDVAEEGDTFEARGPLGGYFIWRPGGRPLVLIGGGSGIAPLRSMWRSGGHQIKVLYSARTADRVIYADELRSNDRLQVVIHLTREQKPGFHPGRLDEPALLKTVEGLDDPAVYVCGPTAFVESVADHLVTILGPDGSIKTERFG